MLNKVVIHSTLAHLVAFITFFVLYDFMGGTEWKVYYGWALIPSIDFPEIESLGFKNKSVPSKIV